MGPGAPAVIRYISQSFGTLREIHHRSRSLFRSNPASCRLGHHAVCFAFKSCRCLPNRLFEVRPRVFAVNTEHCWMERESERDGLRRVQGQDAPDPLLLACNCNSCATPSSRCTASNNINSNSFGCMTAFIWTPETPGYRVKQVQIFEYEQHVCSAISELRLPIFTSNNCRRYVFGTSV